MPNIMLKKSSISAISRQIERMQSETEDAEKKIRSALNGLDFEVASKQNIRNCLNNLITSANRQGNLSGQYKTAFLNVTNSVIESDGKYGNRSQSIFDRIKTFVDDTTKKFKDLFMRNKLAKISAVTGLFMISPIPVMTVIDIKLLEKIASIVKGWFTPSPKKDDSEGGTCPPTDEDKKKQEEAKKRREEMDKVDSQYDEKLKRLGYTDEEIRDARDDSANAAELEEKYNQMIDSAPVKVYEGSSKDTSQGAYGDYNVVKGFKDEYLVDQDDYKKFEYLKEGKIKNGGCTACSDALLGSISKGEFIDPQTIPWDDPGKGGQGVIWQESVVIENTKGISDTECYNIIAQNISNGNAVGFRVTNHSMVAVGIKNGCDMNNVTPNDILIANPGTNKILTLQEYMTTSGRQLDNTWSLRIAK